MILKYNTKVLVKIAGLEFTGHIVGHGAKMFHIGQIYLVEKQGQQVISEEYPYPVCIVPELYLKEVV